MTDLTVLIAQLRNNRLAAYLPCRRTGMCRRLRSRPWRCRTIHDFGGFPQALFDFQYPVAGSPALAGRVQDLLQPLNVAAGPSWGLDHGTWSALAGKPINVLNPA